MAAYWETAAHSAYDIVSMYKYLIVNLVFLTSVFFLIAPFPDRCLLVFFSSTLTLLNRIVCGSFMAYKIVHACYSQPYKGVDKEGES